MIAKLFHNAKAACNLLVFNALCIVVLSLFFPFYLFYRWMREVILVLKETVTAMRDNNIIIYRSYYPKTNKKTQAHVSGGIKKEDVRNN